MDRDTAEHIFDRFWQAPRKDKRLGAGLGLAIVKGIVEAHGGRISLETVAGRGSTFSFTIPVEPRRTPPSPPRLPGDLERRRWSRPTPAKH
jgi:signal transduction histidine kinase